MIQPHPSPTEVHGVEVTRLPPFGVGESDNKQSAVVLTEPLA